MRHKQIERAVAPVQQVASNKPHCPHLSTGPGFICCKCGMHLRIISPEVGGPRSIPGHGPFHPESRVIVPEQRDNCLD